MKVTLPQLSAFQVRHAERIAAVDIDEEEFLVLWGPIQRPESGLTVRVLIDRSDPESLLQLAQFVRELKGSLPDDVEDRLKTICSAD
jgi:hypothetical protein